MTAVPSQESRRARLPTLTARAAIACLALVAVLIGLAPPAADAAVPRSFFGVSAVRPKPADFKRMHDIGAGSFRVEIAWPSVQAHKDAPFAWGGPDQRFRRAATYGLRPLPIIFGAPPFITGDSKHVRGPVESREQRQEWQDFAAAVVERYGPGGDFWQQSPGLNPNLAPDDFIVWNEQNARAFWHPKASPKDYAALLRITRRAFDRVDPSVQMTVGGMYGFPQHRKSMAAKKFLRRLYRKRGAKKVIDGVSVHPYAKNIRGVKHQTRNLRRVMNRAGDRRAHLYVGETGWASAGPKRSFLVKNKRKQAKLLRRAYKVFLNKRKRWRIQGAYWFTWRDYGDDAICNWCPKAGLLNRRAQIKPSGAAYRSLIDRKVG